MPGQTSNDASSGQDIESSPIEQAGDDGGNDFAREVPGQDPRDVRELLVRRGYSPPPGYAPPPGALHTPYPNPAVQVDENGQTQSTPPSLESAGQAARVPDTLKPPPGWVFWLAWLMATILGASVYAAVTSFASFLAPDIMSPFTEAPLGPGLAIVSTACAEWILLRLYIGKVSPVAWGVATIVGWLSCYAIIWLTYLAVAYGLFGHGYYGYRSYSGMVAGGMAGLLGGVALGIIQSGTLKPHIRRSLWVLANAAGLGLLVALWSPYSMPGENTLGPRQVLILLLVGAATGVVLGRHVHTLNRSASRHAAGWRQTWPRGVKVGLGALGVLVLLWAGVASLQVLAETGFQYSEIGLVSGTGTGPKSTNSEGTGSTGPPVSFATSATVVMGLPSAPDCPLAAGDLNEDSHLDLVGPNGSSIWVMLGNGDGTFRPANAGNTPGGTTSVVVQDFNGDGHLDLATANYGAGSVSVLLGNGNGTFKGQIEHRTSTRPYCLAAGDFNGDGHQDLVAATHEEIVWVLLGNGDGTLKDPAGFEVGGQTRKVAVGDFNGDGRLDLTSANRFSNSVSVLLGNGDGTFRRHVDYKVGQYLESVIVGDFNGDGSQDLATANYNSGQSGQVSVLLGNGDGTFRRHVDYAAGLGPWAVAAGDFNGDGHQDLTVTNSNGGTVSVLPGKGDGTLGGAVDFSVEGPLPSVVGDFNADGRPDLAVGSATGTVSVLLNTSGGLPVPVTPTR